MDNKLKAYYNKKFNEKLTEVRNLESQVHHQDAMYKGSLQSKKKDALLQIIKDNIKGKSLLDVGCAEGLFCQFALENGSSHSVGIDIGNKKIERAKKQFPKCTFIVGNVKDIGLEEHFDIVLCSEVLQHLVDYHKCIDEMVNILSKNGLLIISTPNLSSSNDHEFANIDPDMSANKLLKEIGGAGFGKQNAIWKFRTDKLAKEIEKTYNVTLVNLFPIGAKPFPGETKERASNLFTILVFKKTD